MLPDAPKSRLPVVFEGSQLIHHKVRAHKPSERCRKRLCGSSRTPRKSAGSFCKIEVRTDPVFCTPCRNTLPSIPCPYPPCLLVSRVSSLFFGSEQSGALKAQLKRAELAVVDFVKSADEAAEMNRVDSGA